MYNVGSILKFDYGHDGIVEEGHLFILADNFEEEFILQIICIKGYHKGTIEGYIMRETENSKAVSKEHLLKELNRNFDDIKWDTFEDSIEISTID